MLRGDIPPLRTIPTKASSSLAGKEPVLKDIFTKLRMQQAKTKEAVTDLIARLEPYSKK